MCTSIIFTQNKNKFEFESKKLDDLLGKSQVKLETKSQIDQKIITYMLFLANTMCVDQKAVQDAIEKIEKLNYESLSVNLIEQNTKSLKLNNTM